MNNFSNKVNQDYTPQDFTITTIEEHDIKLKFAIWDQMEFLSEEIGIDDPEKVIDTIRECVKEYISEYSPADESFEEFED